MSQIIIHEMSFYYTDFYHPLFENITLNLDTDWKTGLIGRNGRGKTTLLKLLCKELEPTSGTIAVSVPVSLFPYPYNGKYARTLDVVKEMIGGLRTLELAMADALDAGQTQTYCALLEKYQSLNGYSAESRIYKDAGRMQLNLQLFEQDFATLSGGERTRMTILALFLRADGYVLLDEPTNHLDSNGKQALAEYLKKQTGFLVVSHDSHFLNEVTNHILSINKTDLTLEQGNYSTWKRNVLQKEQYELRTRQRLEQEIGQLSRQSAENRKWSDVGNLQKYPFASNARTNGTRAYMRQAKRAEAHIQKNIEEKTLLLRNLEQAEDLAILQERFEEDAFLLRADGLCFSYADTARPLFQDFSIRIAEGERIWLRGKNGVGKSTLLSLLYGKIPCPFVQYAENLRIAAAFQEPKWTRGDVRTMFQGEAEAQNISPEALSMQYNRFLELCRRFDLPEDFTLRPMETLSSGELKKIDIARVLSVENQLLFLDEPLNFMDMLFRQQLADAMTACDVTAIFVEHDETFGYAVCTRIVELEG